MNQINELFLTPWHSILIILNIILIEVILSIDNSAMLATIVRPLPKEQRSKALRYGILGAYLFRGLALFFATYLIHIWFLKPIGGIYLIYLTFKFFKDKMNSSGNEGEEADKKPVGWMTKTFGQLIATIVTVELIDLSLSVDNVLAVVAFSNNVILIILGVFVGILGMRFVAQAFVKLLETYKFLEHAAFLVIGILGIKLTLSALVHYYPQFAWIESETVDYCMSALTLIIFFVPLLTSKFFNFPKKEVVVSNEEAGQTQKS